MLDDIIIDLLKHPEDQVIFSKIIFENIKQQYFSSQWVTSRLHTEKKNSWQIKICIQISLCSQRKSKRSFEKQSLESHTDDLDKKLKK